LCFWFSYWGHVCFLEFTFQKTTFQTFMCLFAIRKVGQRKTLSSQRKIWVMFVFRKVVSGKPLSKLSCVCLPLGNVVNGKHFPVKEKHFPVNEKHFPVKEKFDLVFRKVFSLLLCLFSGKWFPGKHFPNFHVFVCH